VLDNPLPQILPSAVSLVIGRLLRLGIEYIGLAEVRAELLGNHRPAHQLRNSEELDQTGFHGHLGQPGVLLDAVQEV
jgi:hypothetical protein